MYVECNEARFRRAGTPAAGAVASARGLAGMYAAVEHEVGGVPRLLDDETIGQVGQLQVWGRELTQTQPLRTGFAVVFQKPSDHHPWGSYRRSGTTASAARSPMSIRSMTSPSPTPSCAFPSPGEPTAERFT